jgi:hypothetical protein
MRRLRQVSGPDVPAYTGGVFLPGAQGINAGKYFPSVHGREQNERQRKTYQHRRRTHRFSPNRWFASTLVGSISSDAAAKGSEKVPFRPVPSRRSRDLPDAPDLWEVHRYSAGLFWVKSRLGSRASACLCSSRKQTLSVSTRLSVKCRLAIQPLFRRAGSQVEHNPAAQASLTMPGLRQPSLSMPHGLTACCASSKEDATCSIEFSRYSKAGSDTAWIGL